MQFWLTISIAKNSACKNVGDRVEIGGHRARRRRFTRGIRSLRLLPLCMHRLKALSITRIQLERKRRRLHPGQSAARIFRKRVEEEFNRSPERRGHLHDGGIQPQNAFLLDVHDWRRPRGADRGVDGIDCRVAVVAQTIYAATMDHIREYGTLKAMGATNAYLYRVLIEQAVWSAVLGYALAMVVAHFIVTGSEKAAR